MSNAILKYVNKILLDGFKVKVCTKSTKKKILIVMSNKEKWALRIKRSYLCVM